MLTFHKYYLYVGSCAGQQYKFKSGKLRPPPTLLLVTNVNLILGFFFFFFVQ